MSKPSREYDVPVVSSNSIDLRETAKRALDPRYVMQDSELNKLRSAAARLDLLSIASGGCSSPDDYVFRHLQIAFARWCPEEYGQLIRRLLGTLDRRSDDARNHLLVLLPEFINQIEQSGLSAIRSCSLAEAKATKLSELAAGCLALTELIGRPASEQIAIILDSPEAAAPNKRTAWVLSEPTSEDLELLVQKLTLESPLPVLFAGLAYLIALPRTSEGADLLGLLRLLDHPEKRVRSLVMNAMWQQCNKALSCGLAKRWSFRNGEVADIAVYGSLILCFRESGLAVEEVLEKSHPEVVFYLATDSKPGNLILEKLDELVRRRIEGDLEITMGPRTMQRSLFRSKKAVETLVKSRGPSFALWLQEKFGEIDLVRTRPRLSLIAGFDEFPYIHLCNELLRHQPSDGLWLWKELAAWFDDGVVNTDALARIPFLSGPSTEADELRNEVYGDAKTDLDLAKISHDVMIGGCSDWQMSRIRLDLKSPHAGEVARGLALAGLMEATPEAEQFWATELASPPWGGWIETVHARSRESYQRGAWAKHWLGEFVLQGDRDVACAGYALFLECADRRVWGWKDKFFRNQKSALPRWKNMHWQARFDDLKRRIKKVDDSWKETLFGQRIPNGIQSPWR